MGTILTILIYIIPFIILYLVIYTAVRNGIDNSTVGQIIRNQKAASTQTKSDDKK